jgi:hypothetical protein
MKRVALIVAVLGCFSEYAKAVPQAQWIAGVEMQLASVLCKNKYFIECYDSTMQECQSTAKSVTHKCVEQDKALFPKEFDSTSGSQWGAKVGACAGGALETALVSKKRHSGKCDDPSAWIQK